MSFAFVALGAVMLAALAYAFRRSRHLETDPRTAPTMSGASASGAHTASPPVVAPQDHTDSRPQPDAPSRPDTGSRLATTFSDIAERHKLPPLPTAVTLAMSAMREPDVELYRVCRIIATDPALAGRIVSLSRSPLYALRRSPQTLSEALTVLGLEATRRILATAGMDMLQRARTPQSEQLWHHSLATAIAAHLLASRTNATSPDRAYLAGLFHDVGQVVLLQSDHARFDASWSAASDAPAGCDAERAAFGRDHAFIGASILYQWKIDDEIVNAVLEHHGRDHAVATESTVVALADYVAHRAGLGFVAAPATPPDDVLAVYACATTEAMDATVDELQSSFAAELALLH